MIHNIGSIYPPLWISASSVLIAIFQTAYGIYNGEIARSGGFPFMVFINTPVQWCGGAIVDEYHILTAAHCVDCSRGADLRVRAGVVDASSNPGVDRHVKTIHRHPEYNPASMDACLIEFARRYECILGDVWRKVELDNDIAVLTLTEPLPLGGIINKVELPSNEYLPYCTRVWFAGWGSPQDSVVSILRYCLLMIASREVTEEYNLGSKRNEFDAYDYFSSTYAEPGDSGSPLVDENIVYGIAVRADCNLTGSITFTKVYDHLSFILKSMSDVREEL